MLCSSCKRKETTGNFKTCETCRKNKRAYYYRIKEKREKEVKVDIPEERNQFDEEAFISKLNFNCETLRITLNRINDNCYERKDVEDLKKILEFLDDYYDRELYINKINNQDVFNEVST